MGQPDLYKGIVFTKEHAEAILVVVRSGGYVVIPCDGLDQNKLDEMNAVVGRLGIKAELLPTWRLDDGSPLCGLERVRFGAKS